MQPPRVHCLVWLSGPPIHEGNAILKNLDLLSNAISITVQDEHQQDSRGLPWSFFVHVLCLSPIAWRQAPTLTSISVTSSWLVDAGAFARRTSTVMCEPKCPHAEDSSVSFAFRAWGFRAARRGLLVLTLVHLMRGPLVRWCPLGSATGLHAKPESALRCVQWRFEEREEDDTGHYVVSTGHSTWKTILHSKILCVTLAQSQAPISP